MKILCIEDNATTRLLVTAALSEAFPHATILSPESWEDAAKELAELSPDDVVATDGYLELWGPWTASDVFAALARRGMTRRAVLYSSNSDRFPEFHAFASKPQLGELVELVRDIVS